MGNEGPVTLGLLVYPGEYPLGGPIERPAAGVYPQAHWSGATTPPSSLGLPPLACFPSSRTPPGGNRRPHWNHLQAASRVGQRRSWRGCLPASLLRQIPTPAQVNRLEAGGWAVERRGHWPAAMPLPARDEHAALHQHGPARIQVTAAPGLQHLPRARHREQESPFALGCG